MRRGVNQDFLKDDEFWVIKGSFIKEAGSQMTTITASLTKCFVIATPKISSKQTIHYVTYGGQVEMECVTNAYPVPTISWYKDGVITHETSNSTSNRQAVSRMMLENVTLSNAGNYSCQAENMFGVKKLSLYVHVTSEWDLISTLNYLIHYDGTRTFI